MVSKSFNKHGDDAYSMFGHTRHYYPSGGVKINHYFPGKDYNPEVTTTEREPKPVIEKEDLSKPSKVDNKNEISTDAMEKLESLDLNKIKNEKAEKLSSDTPTEIISTAPTVLVPAEPEAKPVVAMQPEIMEKSSLAEKSDSPIISETSTEGNQKEAPQDSEVASSYYNSKFFRYFIGY